MSYHVVNGITGCLPDEVTGGHDWESAKAEVLARFDDLDHGPYTELDLALDNANEGDFRWEFSPEDNAGADYVSIEICREADCEVCNG